MANEKSSGGLDMFKVVLVVCVLAVVGFGILAWLEHQKLVKTKASYAKAERSMAKIRVLHNAVTKLKRKENIMGLTRMNLRVYVERQLNESGIRVGTYNLPQVKTLRTYKKGYKDDRLSIEFLKASGSKKPVAFPRDNIYALLFNLEAQNHQTKVSSITMVAEEVAGRGSRRREEPSKLADRWVVTDLDVLKRIPVKGDLPRKRPR